MASILNVGLWEIYMYLDMGPNHWGLFFWATEYSTLGNYFFFGPLYIIWATICCYVSLHHLQLYFRQLSILYITLHHLQHNQQNPDKKIKNKKKINKNSK